ncbi:hypothetical protein GOP47_0010737 [Adiantum capillus-veneris]|uniref:Sister chromatid cohesion protein DCC1 n=1 Tax=Adiantum capillus-veneris TaxID=13818 RepID=A0A9D4UVN8_ADICA|nr:hypothetical protein GOP47_0010737 [Adiantum capillus-veneris]
MANACVLDMETDSAFEICYGGTFGHEDLKLLEVDEPVLQEVLDRGAMIRGGLNDEAVLCTSTNTYTIKFVMSSNTVLIMPPPLSDGESESLKGNHAGHTGVRSVCAMAAVTGHLEVVEVAPNFEQLKSLLNQRRYKEDTNSMDAEESTALGLYTWEDLLDNVQLSEKELREGLKFLAAVEIGGFWRLVDERFMQSVLELILLNTIQHDWSLHALKEDEVISVLVGDGYSAQIAQHCLATFGRRCSLPCDSSAASEQSCGSDSHVWELDERHVCLHYANQLLSAASKWRLDDFLEAWQQNLPSGLQASLDLLKGEVLVEKLGFDSWLRPFSVSTLPSNPAERFAALFRERSKWEWQDLEPYIGDLRAPGKSVDALLLKYTRRTQPTADASPVFTAR